MTEKELRDLIRRNVVIDAYIEKMIIPKLTVSEVEIKTFYEKNRRHSPSRSSYGSATFL